MNITKFWFLLLFFNIAINLSPVIDWFDARTEASVAVENEVCEKAQITKSSQEESLNLFSNLSIVGLGFTYQPQDHCTPNDQKKAPLTTTPLSFHKEPLLNLLSQRFYLPGDSRAPPQS